MVDSIRIVNANMRQANHNSTQSDGKAHRYHVVKSQRQDLQVSFFTLSALNSLLYLINEQLHIKRVMIVALIIDQWINYINHIVISNVVFNKYAWQWYLPSAKS